MPTEKNQTPKSDGTEKSEVGNAELEQAFAEADAKGYFGEVQDDKDHTVAGVTKAAKEKSNGSS